MEVSLLSCPVCLKPHFQDVDALRTNLISVATTHISCPVCNELLLGLDKLTIHLFSHISNSRANSEATPAKDVEIEKNITENSLNDTVVLNVEMVEKKQLNLTSVEESVEKENSRIICDICNFHFSDETILDLHQKLLHQTSPDEKTGKYSYHCHLCSKQFKMRGSLMVHLRVAHFSFIQNNHRDATNNHKSEYVDNHSQDPILKPAIVTDTISNKQKPIGDQKKIFFMPTQIDKRKIPINPKPQENKQWECEVCLKLFTTKYFLKKHKRLHTGEMPYYCSQCNKYFTFQQSYHKHMLYHSDDKPHVCSECGRAFKELSTLHNHERIHSGERPFSCETCGKCFRQRVSYLVHRRIHTGAMPYKCTACNKSFRYKVSQRSHKCPVSPPGCVVRTPDLVEKLIRNQKVNMLEQNVISQDLCNLQFSINEDQDVNTDQCANNVCNTREKFQFLEQNLNVNTHNTLNVDEIQSYLHDKILDKAKMDLNESALNQPELSDDSANNSLDTCETVGQDNSQEYASFNTNNNGDAKNDVSIAFTSTDNSSPDFFALILSPVLSDVQSLCLSNYTAVENNTKKEDNNTSHDDALQTINEESFKELLYGPASK